MVHGIPWYTTGIPKCKNEIPLVWHTSAGATSATAMVRTTVRWRTVGAMSFRLTSVLHPRYRFWRRSLCLSTGATRAPVLVSMILGTSPDR